MNYFILSSDHYLVFQYEIYLVQRAYLKNYEIIHYNTHESTDLDLIFYFFNSYYINYFFTELELVATSRNFQTFQLIRARSFL